MPGSVYIQSPPQTQAALDQLASLLLGEESTQTVLQEGVDLIQRVMPEGADVSITLLRNDEATTAAFTEEDRRAITRFADFAAVALAKHGHPARCPGTRREPATGHGVQIGHRTGQGHLDRATQGDHRQAFRLLAAASMRANRKLRDIAENLVLTGELDDQAPLPGLPPRCRKPADPINARASDVRSSSPMGRP